MTTLMPVILVCPYCKQQMYEYQMASVTIYKSIFYSDNKTETEPFTDNDYAIRICTKCKREFWSDDAVLQVENPYNLVDKLPKTIHLADSLFKMDDNFQLYSIKYYEKLLKQGFAHNKAKKYYLRMRLWWAINDLIRYSVPFHKLIASMVFERRFLFLLKNRIQQRKLFKSCKVLFRENIEQLILLVDPSDEESNYLLAEMNREIGKFNTAKKFISKVSEQNNRAVKKLKRTIFCRRKQVFQF